MNTVGEIRKLHTEAERIKRMEIFNFKLLQLIIAVLHIDNHKLIGH